MNKHQIAILLLCTSAFLFSCSPSLESNQVSSTPIPTENIGYPADGTISNAYPPSTSNEMRGLPELPAEVPEPQKGFAAISGVIYSFTIDAPIAETGFYLTKVTNVEMIPVLAGPISENGDIEGRTDEKGYFSMDSIPPGEYYLIVWAPMSWSVAGSAENRSEPLLISLAPGDREKLGILYISWP